MTKISKIISKQQGSVDELDILRKIVKSDPFLLDRVVSKILEQRNSTKQGIAELVSEKKGAKKAEERLKGSGT